MMSAPRTTRDERQGSCVADVNVAPSGYGAILGGSRYADDGARSCGWSGEHIL